MRSPVRWTTIAGTRTAATCARTSRCARRSSVARTASGVRAIRHERVHHAAKAGSSAALGANAAASAGSPQRVRDRAGEPEQLVACGPVRVPVAGRGAGVRADQGEPRDALGRGGRERDRRGAALRLADDDGALDARRVEDRPEVGGVVVDASAAGAARTALAAAVVDDESQPRGEPLEEHPRGRRGSHSDVDVRREPGHEHCRGRVLAARGPEGEPDPAAPREGDGARRGHRALDARRAHRATSVAATGFEPLHVARVQDDATAAA